MSGIIPASQASVFCMEGALTCIVMVMSARAEAHGKVVARKKINFDPPEACVDQECQLHSVILVWSRRVKTGFLNRTS